MKNRLLIRLDWILDDFPETDGKQFLAGMPFAARVAWRLVGKRQYRRELAKVDGRCPA